MASKLLLGLVSLVVASCSSAPTKGKKASLSVRDIESIGIGETTDQVVKRFGAPNKEALADGEWIWAYNEADGSQRAVLIFDHSSKRLSEKTILLKEADPESKLSHLLSEKFPSNKFRELRFPQCGMDFISDEGLYFDESLGISILYNRTQRFVISVSWSSAAELKHDIEDIKNCKGVKR